MHQLAIQPPCLHLFLTPVPNKQRQVMLPALPAFPASLFAYHAAPCLICCRPLLLPRRHQKTTSKFGNQKPKKKACMSTYTCIDVCDSSNVTTVVPNKTYLSWHSGVWIHVCMQGFPQVHNEPEDCYQVQKEGRAPPHDVLVTNPPFSADHIMRALRYAGSWEPWPAFGHVECVC